METTITTTSSQVDDLKKNLFSTVDTLLAAVEANNEKEKSLSRTITELENELEASGKQCKLLEEKLIESDNKILREKRSREMISQENDQLKLELGVAEEQCKRYQKICKDTQEMKAMGHMDCQKEVSTLTKEKQDLLARIRELEAVQIERDAFQDEIDHSYEKIQLETKIKFKDVKLESIRQRYRKLEDDRDVMYQKFKEARQCLDVDP